MRGAQAPLADAAARLLVDWHVDARCVMTTCLRLALPLTSLTVNFDDVFADDLYRVLLLLTSRRRDDRVVVRCADDLSVLIGRLEGQVVTRPIFRSLHRAIDAIVLIDHHWRLHGGRPVSSDGRCRISRLQGRDSRL